MKTELSPPSATARTAARILIVDDHPFIRVGLKALLTAHDEFVVCGEAESGAAALKVIEETNPDLGIFDISLKGEMNGIELTTITKKQHPALRVLVLSMHAEPGYARGAIAAGASGFMNKSDAADLLVDALHKILDGQTYVSDDMARHLAKPR